MSRRLVLAGLAVALAASMAAAQSSPKAAMLEQAGWDAIRGGRGPEASQAFGEAIALDARNARLYVGAGIAAFMQRHDDEAQGFLEQALAMDPSLTVARAQLGQVFRRKGDLAGAIREYEAVVAAAPGDADAADTLARWQREYELHERMRMAVGDHFTVSFEGPEDAEMAERALASLEKAFWRICDVLVAYPPASVPVVLYSTRQFQDITRSPEWAAAAYDGTIRVPMRGALDKGEELDRVLAHEFAHALIRSLATKDLPTWLNEGLAAALESDDLSWADDTLGRVAGRPSLADLSRSFSGLDGARAQVAYAASARAARRLLDEAGGAAVSNLLRDLGEGVDFDTAFEHRIQRSFADFEASLGGP